MLKRQLEEEKERNDLPEKKVPSQKEVEALISKTYSTSAANKGNKFNKTGTGRLNKNPSKAENKMIMTY